MVIPESYLAHGLFGRGEERANHKYVARIPTGKNSYRYFYSAAEYKAYKMGKSVGNRIDKMKDRTSNTISAYNNRVRAAARKTSKQVSSSVNNISRDVSKFADRTGQQVNKFVGNAEKNVEKAANTAKKKVSDVLKDVRDRLDEHTLTTEVKDGNTSTEHYGKGTTKAPYDVDSIVNRDARKEAIAMNETKNYVSKHWQTPESMLKSLMEDPEKFAQQWYYFNQQYNHGNNRKVPGEFGQSMEDFNSTFETMRKLARKSPEAREAMRAAGKEYERRINEHGAGNREYAGALHTTDKRTAAEKEHDTEYSRAIASRFPALDKVLSSKSSIKNAIRNDPEYLAALLSDCQNLNDAGIATSKAFTDPKAMKWVEEALTELNDSMELKDFESINRFRSALQKYGVM